MQVLSAKSTNSLIIDLPTIKEKPLLELELSYTKFDDIYFLYEFSDNELVKIMKNADNGAWLLNENYEFGIPMNSIIIKTEDELIHHKYFIYRTNIEYQIFEICDIAMSEFQYFLPNKVWVKKTYATMKEYLQKLAVIYGLDMNKQVVIEE